MKQCKVCGTLVHIDSNTCPSCGNHSFFVLDVKICPLCGKVNNITNSFCEQCGKPFITAQDGGAYINKSAAPLKRPAPNNYKNIIKSSVHAQNISAQVKPITQKIAPQAEKKATDEFNDYIELTPEVKHGDEYVEFAYYIEGNGEKLPVVMLPKFAKTSGKNIIVNIVVNPKGKDKNSSDFTETQVVNNVESTQIDKSVYSKNDEYVQFSSIGNDEEVKSIIPSAPVVENVDSKVTEIAEPLKIAKVKKQKKVKKIKAAKPKITIGKVVSSIVLMLLAFAGLASFYLTYFIVPSNTALNVSGISPILFTLSDVAKFSPQLDFIIENNYVAFTQAFNGGQFAHLSQYVHFIFSGAFVLLFIVAILTIINLRHRKAVKVITSILSFITVLAFAAIIISMIFVFKLWVKESLGYGLIAGAAISILFFILNLILIKTVKKIKIKKVKKIKEKRVKKDELVSL